MSGSRRGFYGSDWLVAAGLAVAVAAAFGPVLGNEFVNYDDDLYILQSPGVKKGLTADSVAWAFTTLRGANWFPLTWLSWEADAELFGLDPGGFHATSLLLHAASASLLYAALLLLTGARWSSALVAAVFALHPLRVESVAWAAARKDVLSGLFAMLALVSYARFALRPSLARGAPVFVCLALGLMAKPTLVTLPFVLLLLDVWPLRRVRVPGMASPSDSAVPSVSLGRALAEKIPLFALVAASSAITFHAQDAWGTVQSLERLSSDQRLSNALVSYVAYIGKLFWPSGLSVYYPYPVAIPWWKPVAAALLLVVATALAVRELPRRPYLAVGWLWYVGTLVPVIGIVQVGGAAMADRYTYLSQIGLVLAIVWGIGEISSRLPVPRAGLAALAGATLLALGVSTNHQVRLWHDSTTLFEHALRVTERNHVAHINLGVAFRTDERVDEAEFHLAEALRIAPRSATAVGIMGEVLHAKGRHAGAARHFKRALGWEPDSPRWRNGLADAQLELGKTEAAVASYRQVLARDPDNPHALANLALALFRKGELEDAVATYEASLREDPRPFVRGNLAVALVELGRDDRAAAEFERALAGDPELALARAHYGKLLARRGEIEAAREQFAEASRLEPETAEFRALLARAQHETGRHALALAGYREAIRLGERSPGTLNDAAWLLATGDSRGENAAEAVALAEEAAAATRHRNPDVLDTLAAAYAAAGREEEAVETASKAIGIAEARGEERLAGEIRQRRARYAERSAEERARAGAR